MKIHTQKGEHSYTRTELSLKQKEGTATQSVNIEGNFRKIQHNPNDKKMI